jgi:hypothetical protein
MVVVNGAAEVARQMADYLTRYYRYLSERNAWASRIAMRNAQVGVHQKLQEKYVTKITEWNNVLQTKPQHIDPRPQSPGIAPEPLKEPEPREPAKPQNLNIHIFRNVPALLPMAPGSQEYWVADVGGQSGGMPGRGQHRVIALADTTSGRVLKRYCTADHYADNIRNTRASFTEF